MTSPTAASIRAGSGDWPVRRETTAPAVSLATWRNGSHRVPTGSGDALFGIGELTLELFGVGACLVGGFPLGGVTGPGDLRLCLGGGSPAAFGDLGGRLVRLFLGVAGATEIGRDPLLAHFEDTTDLAAGPSSATPCRARRR